MKDREFFTELGVAINLEINNNADLNNLFIDAIFVLYLSKAHFWVGIRICDEDLIDN